MSPFRCLRAFLGILNHPWFQENLPEGALDMNAAVEPLDERLLSPLKPKSTVQKILAIAAQPLKVFSKTSKKFSFVNRNSIHH